MKLFDKIIDRVVEKRVSAALSLAELESGFFKGARSAAQTDRDRFAYDRGEVLEQALEAWRVNPLARRIVGLTSQYVVGGGITVSCKHGPTARFLKDFWDHRLNRLPMRVYEWCDELTRTGNLFVLLSTDAAGMSYVRAVPANDIDRIEARQNDIEQPTAFFLKADLENPEPVPVPAYDISRDHPTERGKFKTVMLHYAINRPVGAQWGESDLAPVLKWLSRYANWLEDRARLNRFRNAFLYVVKAKFASEAERIARQQLLNSNPPGPGSILVTDDAEEWSVISPHLEASDANTDGLALKKMIASGSGVPLHFLAEPESSTRTTAEAAGGPTYRHYEQRQNFYLWVLRDLLVCVVARRALVDSRVSRRAEIQVLGADISARDNVALSLAGNNVLAVLNDLRDRQLIDDAELLRIFYRFTGETVDIPEMLEKGRAAGPSLAAESADQAAADIKSKGGVKSAARQKIDPETGELKPGNGAAE
jgi:hypothetical protein